MKNKICNLWVSIFNTHMKHIYELFSGIELVIEVLFGVYNMTLIQAQKAKAVKL